MRMIVRVSGALVVLSLCLKVGAQSPAVKIPVASGPARDFSTLQIMEQVVIPNVVGRLDHFTVDVPRRRVILSGLGNNSVEVVDTFAGRSLKSIGGVVQPQGVLYLAELDKLFVAGAGDGKVHVFDGKTYVQRSEIEIGESPDNLRFDAVTKMVVVGFGEEDGGLATIDPVREVRVGEVIRTGGHPESFQFEASGGRVFVNVPDAGDVVEAIDRKTGAIQKWPLKGLQANYPMALNEQDHRLYTVTRKTPMLVVMDTTTGKEVARMRVAGECDDIFYDAMRRRIYVIGAEGFVTVVQVKDPDHYEVIENVPTAIGVRTGTFYIKRDKLIVGVPAKGNEPAQMWTFEAED